MRVCVTAKHRYPAGGIGPSGGHVFDLLVRGLAELGHEVFYRPQLGISAPLPPGVAFVEQPEWDVEIVHGRSDDDLHSEARRRGIPWVATCHADLLTTWGRDRGAASRHWIYPSRSLAGTYGSARFVRNGIDPGEFTFSRQKGDYLLFLSMLRFARRKGLDTALRLSRTLGFRLVVAGTCDDAIVVDRVERQCREAGAEFVGPVVGPTKARLLAEARALLFPTELNEGFGLVLAEAMMSGTPVICSDSGACPEIVTADVGFVCTSEGDYRRAAPPRLDEVRPDACREKALRDFHYLRMAADYVREYQGEIAQAAGPPGSCPWRAGGELVEMMLPVPFVDINRSNLRLDRKVCVVAPGPNGRGHYGRIPADFQVVAVSKAVLIAGLRPSVWMMTHSDQPWFAEANRGFRGIRLFSYDAAVHAADALQGTPDCYAFVPPHDSFLEPGMHRPLDGMIRYGATVSGCAIQFAAISGAAEILLCGVDLSGDEYFDGTVNVNSHHGDSWPAIRSLQPFLRQLSDDAGLMITTLSPTRLDLPTYGA